METAKIVLGIYGRHILSRAVLQKVGFNLQMLDIKNYEPQRKIRPRERHKSLFITECHLY